MPLYNLSVHCQCGDGLEGTQAGDPERIGRYRIIGRLGSGGMGRVYLGRSAGGRLLAIKVIRAELAEDPSFRTRFSREVDAAKKVSGVFTASVVDADVDGPVPWLATAYVPGMSLAEAVSTRGRLPTGDLLALAAGLAEGLIAIHAVGLVHRDLKPANVLLAQDGPRVIDFGISRAAEASALTGTGWVVGSPGFMSPEQAEGREVGPPSDVFSLGGVLTFAGTGEGPFGSGSAAALIYRIVHSPPAIADLPEPVRELAGRCLRKDPGQRPTPAQILSELEDAQPVESWLPQPVIEQVGPQLAPEREDIVDVGAVTPPASAVGYPPTVTTAGASAPSSPTQSPPQGPPPSPRPATTGPGASPAPQRRRSRAALTALIALSVAIIGCVLAFTLPGALKPKPASLAQSTPPQSTAASASGQAASVPGVNPCQNNPAESAVVGSTCFSVPPQYYQVIRAPDYLGASGPAGTAYCPLGIGCTNFIVLTGQAYDSAFHGQDVGSPNQALGFSFSVPLNLDSFQSFTSTWPLQPSYSCTERTLAVSDTQPFGRDIADYREWTYDCPKDKTGTARELQVWNVPAAKIIVISYAPVQTGSTPVQAMVAHATFIKGTSAELSAPVLTSPKSGTVFGNFPRNTKLSWNPVPGAVEYLVEIQSCNPYGCGAAPSGEWADNVLIIEQVDETSYSFEFAGAQPGRWSVIPVRPDGELGRPSAWWGFTYTE
jgi:serine/threonine protein kinase